MNAFRTVAFAAAMTAMAASFSACAQKAPSSVKAEAQSVKAEPPAKLEGHAVKEADLSTIVLTTEAENRLGIRLEEAKVRAGSEVRRFSGEVTVPPGNSFVVSSPVAGTLQAAGSPIPDVGSFVNKDQPIFRLTPLVATTRDMEVNAKADLDQARIRLETAKTRKARAEKMLADEVGTVRAVEETQQEVELAMAAVQATEARLKQIQVSPLDADVQMIVRAPADGMLRQMLAAPGQQLNAGAPLFEVVDLQAVWIRVPVYAGEVSRLITTAPVTVQPLNGIGASRTASPVPAPPSGDPAASTINLYYSISNEELRFRPGEKLLVALRSSDTRTWIVIPSAAVVFDTQGGTWVYESLGDHRYARRRVDVDHTTSGIAFLSAGLREGTRIVTDGAAELWGFEFGTGK